MVHDSLLTKLADILVNYSVLVQPNDLVLLKAPLVSRPLVVSLYEAVLNAGAYPHVEMAPDECVETLLMCGNEDQLRHEDPFHLHAIEQADVCITIWSHDYSPALAMVNPRQQTLMNEGRRRFSDRLSHRAANGELRWVGTHFPNAVAAQLARMSLADYKRFVWQAGFLHYDDPIEIWRNFSQRQQRMIDSLRTVRQLRITTPQGTDLTVEVDGRMWINCDGHENFPDGEVFTSPLEDSTQGAVFFSFPAMHEGREADGVRLEFKDGRVTDVRAKRGEEFLIAMLDQDPGARVLGEIALGTNYAVTQSTRNTLLDEKMGGTFHLGLGAGHPETGARNVSATHWDMVCDLRFGGKILADGQAISENGRFMNPNWPRTPPTTSC
ncbi:MAG: aminopeptidase [Planctomycetes bacterium]|nr:aminopeptidase [Planctomycetota bacterium]